MQKSYSLREVRDLTGVEQGTQRDWIDRGLLTVVDEGRGRGKGRERYVDAMSVFLTSVNRHLISKGMRRQISDPMVQFLATFTPDTLQAEIDDGNTILFYGGDDHPPKLIPLAFYTGEESEQPEAVAFGIAFDVGRAWQQFKQGIAAWEKSKQAKCYINN